MRVLLPLFLMMGLAQAYASDLLICSAKPGGGSEKPAESRAEDRKTPTDCSMIRFGMDSQAVAWERNCNPPLTASISATDDYWVLNGESDRGDWMAIRWINKETGKRAGSYTIQGFLPSRSLIAPGGQLRQPRNLANFGNGKILLCRARTSSNSTVPESASGQILFQAFSSKKILSRTPFPGAAGIQQKFSVAQGFEKPGFLLLPKAGASWKLFSCELEDDGTPKFQPILPERNDIQDAAAIEGEKYLVICGQELLTVDKNGALQSREVLSHPGMNHFSAEFVAISKEGDPVLRLAQIPVTGKCVTILKSKSGSELLDDRLPVTSPISWRDGELALIDVKNREAILVNKKGRKTAKLPAGTMIPFSVEIFPTNPPQP